GATGARPGPFPPRAAAAKAPRQTMTLMTLNDLGVTLSDTLFSDLNLTINTGDRIGLVAANGRGKSTFLRCLAGSQDPTFGRIVRSRGLTCGHLGQDVPEALMPLGLREAVARALADPAE